MTIGFVAAGPVAIKNNALTITPTFGVATKAGDALVAIVTINQNETPTTTSAGWAKWAGTATTTPRCYFFVKLNCAATETAPTFKFATTGGAQAALAEFSGVFLLTAEDKTGAQTSSSVTSRTVTASGADSFYNDLAVAGVRLNNSTGAFTTTFSRTPTTWTKLATSGATSTKGHIYWAYKIETAGGQSADTVKISWTGSAVKCASSIITLKAASVFRPVATIQALNRGATF